MRLLLLCVSVYLICTVQTVEALAPMPMAEFLESSRGRSMTYSGKVREKVRKHTKVYTTSELALLMIDDVYRLQGLYDVYMKACLSPFKGGEFIKEVAFVETEIEIVLKKMKSREFDRALNDSYNMLRSMKEVRLPKNIRTIYNVAGCDIEGVLRELRGRVKEPAKKVLVKEFKPLFGVKNKLYNQRVRLDALQWCVVSFERILKTPKRVPPSWVAEQVNTVKYLVRTMPDAKKLGVESIIDDAWLFEVAIQARKKVGKYEEYARKADGLLVSMAETLKHAREVYKASSHVVRFGMWAVVQFRKSA
jgi:hypothetical protein